LYKVEDLTGRGRVELGKARVGDELGYDRSRLRELLHTQMQRREEDTIGAIARLCHFIQDDDDESLACCDICGNFLLGAQVKCGRNPPNQLLRVNLSPA
jgi:hypothetical protein